MYEQSFNRDPILRTTYKSIVETYKPEVLIETGLFEGNTTEYMCSFNIPVISTEIDEGRIQRAKNKLSKYPNLVILKGDSEQTLRANKHLFDNKFVLVYLDAHCRNDRCLQRELEFIREWGKRPIIFIHDFFVPNKRWQFDTWDGHRLDLEHYGQYFDKIYGVNKWVHTYPTEVSGPMNIGYIIIREVLV